MGDSPGVKLRRKDGVVCWRVPHAVEKGGSRSLVLGKRSLGKADKVTEKE